MWGVAAAIDLLTLAAAGAIAWSVWRGVSPGAALAFAWGRRWAYGAPALVAGVALVDLAVLAAAAPEPAAGAAVLPELWPRLAWLALLGAFAVAAARSAPRASDAATREMALLAAAIESLDEAFALWDPDDRLVLWNRRFAELHPKTGHRLRGGLVYGDYLRGLVEHRAIVEALGREEEWLAESLANHRAAPARRSEVGHVSGASLLVSKQVLPNGCMAHVIVDVTARKRADQATVEHETLLASILDHLPLGLLITDPDRVVEQVNPVYLDWFRMGAAEDVIGRRREPVPWGRPAEDLAAMLAQEDEVLATGETRTRTVERQLGDGRIHTLRITKFPVWDQDGRVARIGSVGVDVTEEVEARNALAQSEARFRDFAEIGADLRWETDAEHRFVGFADGRADGHDRSGLIGRTPWDFAADDVEPDQFWQSRRATMEARQEFRNVEYWHAAFGERRCVRVSGRPVFGADGAFLGYRGVTTDVTARRLAEEREREMTALLRAVLDNSPNLISIRARDGRLLMANPAFAQAFGAPSADAWRGRTIAETAPGANGEIFARQHRKVVETGQPVVEEVELERPWGQVAELIVRFPIPDAAGDVAMVGTIGADITDRKAMVAALALERDRAEAASRAKSAFLARMSHELRTPLNAILGFAQLLQMNGSASLSERKAMSYVEDILSSGEHLLGLVNDVLDVAQIEAGAVQLRPAACSFGEAYLASLNMAERAATGPLPEIRNRCGPDLPPIWADPRSLRQILVNLLANAIRHTPADGGIVVEAAPRGEGWIEVSIADSGPGIDPAMLETVLQPFATIEGDGDGYDSAATRGVGLGLPIAKGLVEAHGGRLRIESAPGRGVVARFTLPAAESETRLEPPARMAQSGRG